MKLSRQVCLPEIAKRLLAHGVNQHSHHAWIPRPKPTNLLLVTPVGMHSSQIAAFTVAELGLMLGPGYSYICYRDEEKHIRWGALRLGEEEETSLHGEGDLEAHAAACADAMALLLLKALEFGYLKLKDVNERLIA